MHRRAIPRPLIAHVPNVMLAENAAMTARHQTVCLHRVAVHVTADKERSTLINGPHVFNGSRVVINRTQDARARRFAIRNIVIAYQHISRALVNQPVCELLLQVPKRHQIEKRAKNRMQTSIGVKRDLLTRPRTQQLDFAIKTHCADINAPLRNFRDKPRAQLLVAHVQQICH